MSDFLLGAIGLVLFLAVVFAAGYVFYRFKNARLASEWGPLVAMVNGKVVGDGGGGATSWLVGTYKGRPIQASIVPDHNMYSSLTDTGSSPSERYNYFEVALTDVPGAADWRIAHGQKTLGIGQEGWRLQSADPAVEAGLTAANVVALVAAQGTPPRHMNLPIVQYQRSQGQLLYRADVSPRRAPTPEQFGQLVDMLLQLMEVNARVNPARRV